MSARGGGEKKSAHTHTQLRFDRRVCLCELPPSAVCRAGEEREGEGYDFFFFFFFRVKLNDFFLLRWKEGLAEGGGRGGTKGCNLLHICRGGLLGVEGTVVYDHTYISYFVLGGTLRVKDTSSRLCDILSNI